MSSNLKYNNNDSNELVYVLIWLLNWSFEVIIYIWIKAYAWNLKLLLNFINWMSYVHFLWWNDHHIYLWMFCIALIFSINSYYHPMLRLSNMIRITSGDLLDRLNIVILWLGTKKFDSTRFTTDARVADCMYKRCKLVAVVK